MKTTDVDFPAALRAAAEGWVGTPFRPLHSRQGIAVDCANSVYATLRDAGVSVPEIGAPTFGMSPDTDFGNQIGSMADKLVVAGTLQTVDDLSSPQIQPGDVLLCRVNGRTQHMAVAVSSTEHLCVWPGRDAAIAAIDPRLLKRLIKHYRLTNV
jgi:cell wall-associated NlpC family hydrolase